MPRPPPPRLPARLPARPPACCLGGCKSTPAGAQRKADCYADPPTQAAVNIFFHGVATAQLLWDERRITFRDPLAQQLWKFFYRRAGMDKAEFVHVSGSPAFTARGARLLPGHGHA